MQNEGETNAKRIQEKDDKRKAVSELGWHWSLYVVYRETYYPMALALCW